MTMTITNVSRMAITRGWKTKAVSPGGVVYAEAGPRQLVIYSYDDTWEVFDESGINRLDGGDANDVIPWAGKGGADG